MNSIYVRPIEQGLAAQVKKQIVGEDPDWYKDSKLWTFGMRKRRTDSATNGSDDGAPQPILVAEVKD